MQEQKESAGAKKASISDYFKVIGVKRCFELDLDQLEKKYCQLQTVFHPDAIDKNNLSNVEMDVYLKKISTINKAYHCLKDPISRANHLIELKGFDAKGGVSINYLEQIIDLKEKILEDKVGNEVEVLYNKHFENMKNAFKRDNYEDAHLSFLLLKYILKLKIG